MIQQLLKRISPALPKIKELKKQDSEVVLIFHLSIAPKSTDVPLWLEKKVLQQIGKLEANLDIEFFDL